MREVQESLLEREEGETVSDKPEQLEIQPVQDQAKPLSLVGKLAAAFAAVGGLEKKGRNQAQGYDYLKAADVAKAVRMELFSRGIILLSDVEKSEWSEFTTMKGSRMTVCRLTVRFTFYDGTETLSFRGVGEAFDTGDKSPYKSTTGALKYALRTAGLIPDEKDDPEADEKVDREMAQDGVSRAEEAALSKFNSRVASQPPPEPVVARNQAGYVLITKVEEKLTKAKKTYWLLSVTPQGGASDYKVSVWDAKLQIPELWAASGKDAKIGVKEDKKGDKTYYSLEKIYVIGSKNFATQPPLANLPTAPDFDGPEYDDGDAPNF